MMLLKRTLELAGAAVAVMAAANPARFCLLVLAYRRARELHPELFDGVAAAASVNGRIAELIALDELIALELLSRAA